MGSLVAFGRFERCRSAPHFVQSRLLSPLPCRPAAPAHPPAAAGKPTPTAPLSSSGNRWQPAVAGGHNGESAALQAAPGASAAPQPCFFFHFCIALTCALCSHPSVSWQVAGVPTTGRPYRRSQRDREQNGQLTRHQAKVAGICSPLALAPLATRRTFASSCAMCPCAVTLGQQERPGLMHPIHLHRFRGATAGRCRQALCSRRSTQTRHALRSHAPMRWRPLALSRLALGHHSKEACLALTGNKQPPEAALRDSAAGDQS